MKSFHFELLILIIVFSCFYSGTAQIKTDSITIAPFGKVHLYIPKNTPASVTIMISGDAGWKYGIIDFSKHFANQNSLVIGIDILQYYKNLRSRSESCYHVTGDFVTMANSIEKRYGLPTYQEPILMGYSSGATLVYAVLSQARANTFKGGISLGFCPDIELPKPFCELNGLKQHRLADNKTFVLDPDSNLSNLWIVLQGKLDKICDFNDTKAFLDKTSDDELIVLNNVGHGFSNWRDFMSQWDKAFQKILSETNVPTSNSKVDNSNDSIKGLPIVLTKNDKQNGNTLMFFISGDGGWYSFEQSISDKFLNIDIPTVGLDSKKYFWNRKSPQQSADDISNILHYYMTSWKKQKVILVGYSIGAEVLPFIFEKLPKDLQQSSNMVLLSPDEMGDFEVHYSNMMGFESSDNRYNVLEELKKISNITSIKVIFGNDEHSKIPDTLSKYKISFAAIPGDHHYNNDYKAVFEAVLKDM